MTVQIGVRLVTAKEAAERLGIHPASVRAALADGRLRGTKISKVWLVDEASLLYFKPRYKPPRNPEKRAEWEARRAKANG